MQGRREKHCFMERQEGGLRAASFGRGRTVMDIFFPYGWAVWPASVHGAEKAPSFFGVERKGIARRKENM